MSPGLLSSASTSTHRTTGLSLINRDPSVHHCYGKRLDSSRRKPKVRDRTPRIKQIQERPETELKKEVRKQRHWSKGRRRTRKTKRRRRLKGQPGESGNRKPVRGTLRVGGWVGGGARDAGAGPARVAAAAEAGKAHFAGNLLSCFWAAPPAAAARPGCLFQY